jgi:hypothetical protein
MPARSSEQLKLIYAKRNQYKSKDHAPNKWKWVFDPEWGNLDKKEGLKKYHKIFKKHNNF